MGAINGILMVVYAVVEVEGLYYVAKTMALITTQLIYTFI